MATFIMRNEYILHRLDCHKYIYNKVKNHIILKIHLKLVCFIHHHLRAQKSI